MESSARPIVNHAARMARCRDWVVTFKRLGCQLTTLSIRITVRGYPRQAAIAMARDSLSGNYTWVFAGAKGLRKPKG